MPVPLVHMHTPWEADTFHSSLSAMVAGPGSCFLGIRCLQNWLSESYRNILPDLVGCTQALFHMDQKLLGDIGHKHTSGLCFSFLFPTRCSPECMLSQENSAVGYRAASNFHTVCSGILNWPNQDRHSPLGGRGLSAHIFLEWTHPMSQW